MSTRKITITIDEWLYQEIERRFPSSKSAGFRSRIYNKLLAASVNNPIAYYRYEAQKAQRAFQAAMLHKETLEQYHARQPEKAQERQILVGGYNDEEADE